MAPRLLSGRTTPTFRVPGGRGSIIAGALAAFTPNAAAPAAAGAAGQLVQQQAAVLTPEDSSTSSAAGSGPAAGESCSSSIAGSSSRHSAAGIGVSGPAAAVSPTSTTAAVVAQEQLLRMQEAWRESVEKDVICLREVLGQYKEQAERLEMQKKLLLSQVGDWPHQCFGGLQSICQLFQLHMLFTYFFGKGCRLWHIHSSKMRTL